MAGSWPQLPVADKDYVLAAGSQMATKRRAARRSRPRTASNPSNSQGLKGLSMNSTQNNQWANMSLRGILTQESFVLKIIRQSPDGKHTIEPLPPPEGKSVAVIMAEKCGTKYPNMVPGVEK
ncbi:hypothetical protein DFH08DRAFT_812531 [Mycena albidolilacea]|uniref:Uncharacterized protein n=1 Tax=Mycena albidolilacea TaxID=1033008 RepID=A0AAD6ZUY2_9AGAR|nr:hypothetical protein DFH08DRAFT_812531 [Mycena albidolilacea]